MKKTDFGKLPLKTLIAILLSGTLAACGGDDSGSRLENINNGNTGGDVGGGNENDDDGELDTTPEGVLGSISQGSFTPGVIDSSANDETVLPGSQVRLSVALQDPDTQQVINTTSDDVTFSSECLSSGNATLTDTDGNLIENGTVSLDEGRAEVIYVVADCLGEDEVRAQAAFENSSVDTATTNIEVVPPSFGSGQGEDFSLGAVSVESAEQIIQPGQSTGIAVTLIGPDGRYAQGSSSISFRSSCLDEGLATLTDDEGTVISEPVETNAGRLDLTYTSNGCLNEDNLQATAIYEGVESGEAEATVIHAPARFGRGEADAFTQGEIEIGVGTATLSAGGSTSLEVTLVDEQGDLIPVASDIEFSSSCLNRGLAKLSNDSSRTFATEDGVLEVTYTAAGCDGSDNITATASVGENPIGKAYGVIEVEADAPQNIVFTGSDPDLISIKSAGGDESATLTFQVLGTTGTPLRDVQVAFELSNEMGGSYLSHETATSDASGYALTTVNAGNVPNTVRVTASTGDVTTESSRLTISTGIPDQNSFSLAVENHFPVAAWNVDGVETSVTIRLADAYNNPVPDGTAVYFTTSGGSIESSCLSEGGACTVNWTSQSPRPGRDNTPMFSVTEQTNGDGDVTGFSIDACPNGLSECRFGRTQVLATALGNESFIDQTGNALYDGPNTDIFATGGNCSRNRPTPSAAVVSSDVTFIENNGCDDLGEAYLDKNFNGQRDDAEEYVDGNEDGGHTEGDGIYNGILCSDDAQAAGECSKGTVTIRDHQTIVMTCDRPYVMPNRLRLPGQRDVKLALGGSDSVTMLLADCNGNGMPEGTEVSLDLSGANNVTASVSPDAPLGASGNPTTISVTLEADENEPASGTLRIIISSPSGNGVQESVETIQITPA